MNFKSLILILISIIFLQSAYSSICNEKWTTLPGNKKSELLAIKKFISGQEKRIQAQVSVPSTRRINQLLKSQAYIKAADFINERNFDITIQRSGRSRYKIAKDQKLLNLHHIGNDKNYGFTPVERDAAESAMLGMSITEYQKINNDLKPKYGLLTPKLGQELAGFKRISYGPDHYILDQEKLKGRLTWTPGDSLDNYDFFEGEEYLDGNPKLPKNWQSYFQPWNKLNRLAPLIAREVSLGRLQISHKHALPKEVQFMQYLGEAHERTTDYIEVQIWGELDLSLVKAFVFKRKEPSGEFLKVLLSNGIRIFDGRKNQNIYDWGEQEDLY